MNHLRAKNKKPQIYHKNKQKQKHKREKNSNEQNQRIRSQKTYFWKWKEKNNLIASTNFEICNSVFIITEHNETSSHQTPGLWEDPDGSLGKTPKELIDQKSKTN